VAETSAGILLYRRAGDTIEVFVAHMGGPFWSGKDAAAWSIPKGLYDPGEQPLAAALREFEEEVGVQAPDADYELLGAFRQPSGKVVTVFAAEADLAIGEIVSNTFTIEWPPHSGVLRDFPEIDDARWLPLELAREKLVKGQRAVLDALLARIAEVGESSESGGSD
jgi:predicted NUDIX family NTP pyrophosphohydrolase